MSIDMFPDGFVRYVLDNEFCEVCNKEIKTMAFKKTGVCGENCRKVRDGETTEQRAQVHAAIVPAVVKGKVKNPNAIR
jgi:hypothetical protein